MREDENPELFSVKQPFVFPGRGEVAVTLGLVSQDRKSFVPEVHLEERRDLSRGKVELDIPVGYERDGFRDRFMEHEPA